MEDRLFDRLVLSEVRGDLARNIVSIQHSQDLFDDLSDKEEDWLLAQATEDEVKPLLYQSRMPIIDRPFEDAEWFNAIAYPFRNWQASRFSDGTFGIWYGAESIQTTVHETVHHWYHGFLSDAGFCEPGVTIERKVYWVRCDAALLDFRAMVEHYPGLVHPHDYSLTRSIGARIMREGHPGLVAQSARCAGESYVVLNPRVLSEPRNACYLRYRVQPGRIEVERNAGELWMDIPV